MTNQEPNLDADGVDLNGPATEGTARQLLAQAKKANFRSSLAIVAAVIAIASAGVSIYNTFKSNQDRCESGNRTREAIVLTGTDTEYLDTVLEAFGININIDLSQIPEDQREQAQILFEKLRVAKQKQIDKYEKNPAFKQRDC